MARQLRVLNWTYIMELLKEGNLIMVKIIMYEA